MVEVKDDSHPRGRSTTIFLHVINLKMLRTTRMKSPSRFEPGPGFRGQVVGSRSKFLGFGV